LLQIHKEQNKRKAAAAQELFSTTIQSAAKFNFLKVTPLLRFNSNMGFQAASSANGTFDKGDTITNGATLANGTSHSYGSSGTNSTTQVNSVSRGDIPTPIAICGMALRLPGALSSPEELWDFLLNKGDGRCRVPETRYNVNAYHSTSKRPGTVASKYGYFLDESVRLGCLDTNRFSLTRAELELADPQHRLMLEVTREALDDAGETNFKVFKFNRLLSYI
jgi:hypothetical protein